MSERVELYVLAVGQGSCNLVAFYDGDNLLSLDLIDCGRLSGKMTNEDLEKQMQFLREKMEERARLLEDVQYALDHLIITHADADHINLLTSRWFLKDLIPNPNGMQNTVKEVACADFLEECGPLLENESVYIYYSATPQEEAIQYYLQVDWEESEDVSIGMELCIRWLGTGDETILDQEVSAIVYNGVWESTNVQVNVEAGWKEADGSYCIKSFRCKTTVSESKVYLEGALAEEVFQVQFRIKRSEERSEEWPEEWPEEICGEITFAEEEDIFQMLEEIAQWIEEISKEVPGIFLEVAEHFLVDLKQVIEYAELWGNILDVLNAENALEYFEEEQEKAVGMLAIGTIYMGGLSRELRENRASVRKKLNVLASYSAQDIIYMQGDWAEEQDDSSFLLQKLPCCGTITGEEGQQNYQIEDENASSIAYLKKMHDDFIIMLPGDATGDTMWYFKNCIWPQRGVPKGVWMTAPHHGADVSTFSKTFDRGNRLLDAYLEEIEPNGIIISAGYNNRYGHPHKAFLETAQQYTAESQAGENCLICSSGQGNPWEEQPVGKNIFACLEKIEDENFYCGYFNRKVTFLSDGTVVNEKCGELTMFETPPTPMASIENPEQDQNQELASAMFGTERGFDFLIGESSEV